jgi:GNAT superfamily N-acetyltransferase
MDLQIAFDGGIDEAEVLDLYRGNKWSAAEKPVELLAALRNSHSLVTARIDGKLVGLANAISDGHLVVYFPHMLVAPDWHGQGIGKKIMQAMLGKYRSFHQLMLTADGDSVEFYKRLGFVRAGRTEPMWIYEGTEH